MRAALPTVAVAMLLLAGCAAEEPAVGEPTSTGAVVEADTAGEPKACAPVAGEELVVLEDDLNTIAAQNVIPAVHSFAAEPALLAALDAASAALDTPRLAALNRAVDVEGVPAAEAAAAFLSGAGVSVEAGSGSGPVVVGAGGTSESVTLAHVYAQALTQAGYGVEVRIVGERESYQPALVTGEITVVPEYVGEFANFLATAVNGPGANSVARPDVEGAVAVLERLGDKVGLVFGEPSAAARNMAFAVTAAFAEKHGVSTLSELAAACAGGVVVGGPSGLGGQDPGYPGLEQTYAVAVSRFTALDDGGPLTKSALTGGQVAVGVVYTSDAALAPPVELAG